MKYYLLVVLLILSMVLSAIQSPQFSEIYSQMQENQLRSGNRVLYDYYWMRFLPPNYIDCMEANEFQYSEEDQYGWEDEWIIVTSSDLTYTNNLVSEKTALFSNMNFLLELTYDGNNNLSQTNLYLEGTEMMRETFGHNANGILNSYLKEMNSAGNWTNESQQLFTLDGDYINTIIEQGWDEDTQAWLNEYKFTLTWDGDVVTEVLREEWEVDHWDNSMLYAYNYLDDMLSESLAQYWNGTIWINSQNKFYTWAGDLITNELMKGWNGNAWEDEMNEALTFDDFNRPLELMGTVWDNDQWENDHRFEYFYTTGSSNNTLPDNSFKLSNYPNPFNPETTIEFNIAEGNPGTLEIFNLKGQIIHSQEFESGDHTYRWNADSQASGIYFYKVSSGDFEQKNKMILLK